MNIFLSFEILCLPFSSLPKRACQWFVSLFPRPTAREIWSPDSVKKPYRGNNILAVRVWIISDLPRCPSHLRWYCTLEYNRKERRKRNSVFPEIICVLIKCKLRSSGVYKILAFCVHIEFNLLLILKRSEINCPPGYSSYIKRFKSELGPQSTAVLRYF